MSVKLKYSQVNTSAHQSFICKKHKVTASWKIINIPMKKLGSIKLSNKLKKFLPKHNTNMILIILM